MEEGKKLISEESHKKGKKFFIVFGSLLAAFAAILAVIGIILIVTGITKQGGYSMQDPEWFDNKTKGMSIMFGGIVLLFFGFACGGVSVWMFFIAHARAIGSFAASTVLPLAKEGVEDYVAPTLGKVVGEVRKGWRSVTAKKVCSKCGAENANENKFCASCGNNLGGFVCPHCNHEMEQQYKFCPHCGKEV